MNEARRKVLASVAKRLSEIMEEIKNAKALSVKLIYLRNEIDSVCNTMESATSQMEDASSAIDDLISALDDLNVQTIIDALEGAAE
jgi:ABC-type transporter Mla subunit MlaD